MPNVNIRIHQDNGLLCKVTFWTDRDREGFTEDMFSDAAYDMVRDVLLLNTGGRNPFWRPVKCKGCDELSLLASHHTCRETGEPNMDKHWYRVTFGARAVWVYCELEDRFGKAYQQAKQLGLV